MRTNFYSGPAFFLTEEIISDKKNAAAKIYFNNRKGYFFCKRVSDIIVSFVFIVGLMSWLLPVIALLIKLFSKGPIFFLQKRVGRYGRTFTCYKFRTMVLNTEADKVQASYEDERITGIGKILRRLNLDEFPQFFNVFIGDMSIVGPRPHMHADYNKFSSVIPSYKFRDLLRPGITGLAQIKGFTGPATDMESIFGRYQWDAFYVRNANVGLDLRIMRKTIAQQFYSAGKLFISIFMIVR